MALPVFVLCSTISQGLPTRSLTFLRFLEVLHKLTLHGSDNVHPGVCDALFVRTLRFAEPFSICYVKPATPKQTCSPSSNTSPPYGLHLKARCGDHLSSLKRYKFSNQEACPTTNETISRGLSSRANVKGSSCKLERGDAQKLAENTKDYQCIFWQTESHIKSDCTNRQRHMNQGERGR